MLNYIFLTISFIVAILVSSAIMMYIVTSSSVMKWCTRKSMQTAKEIEDEYIDWDD